MRWTLRRATLPMCVKHLSLVETSLIMDLRLSSVMMRMTGKTTRTRTTWVSRSAGHNDLSSSEVSSWAMGFLAILHFYIIHLAYPFSISTIPQLAECGKIRSACGMSEHDGMLGSTLGYIHEMA